MRMASRFSKIQSVFFDLSEFQINRRGAPKDQNRHFDTALLVIKLFHHATEVCKGSVDNTHHLTGLKQRFRLRLIDTALNTLQDGIRFPITNRSRLVWRTTNKAHYTRRRLDQVPGFVIHLHLDQYVTGVKFTLAFALFAIAHFHHFFSGDQNIAKTILKPLKRNTLLQGTHYLLFIT